MKAEEGHHHSPNATPPLPNGKPLSFGEGKRAHLGYSKREESQTTSRTFRLGTGADWDPKRSSKRENPWPLVSEGVREAWVTGRGEGNDPEARASL